MNKFSSIPSKQTLRPKTAPFSKFVLQQQAVYKPCNQQKYSSRFKEYSKEESYFQKIPNLFPDLPDAFQYIEQNQRQFDGEIKKSNPFKIDCKDLEQKFFNENQTVSKFDIDQKKMCRQINYAQESIVEGNFNEERFFCLMFGGIYKSRKSAVNYYSGSSIKKSLGMFENK